MRHLAISCGHGGPVLVIGAVLTLGLLATVLLQSPAPTQTVDELMAAPGDHVNQEVAVRGEVQDGTIDNSTMMFVLEGGTAELTVRFTDAMVSNGLDDNRTGTLRHPTRTVPTLKRARSTSCPSKYEAASSRCLDIGQQTGCVRDRWGARRTPPQIVVMWTNAWGGVSGRGSRRRTRSTTRVSRTVSEGNGE